MMARGVPFFRPVESDTSAASCIATRHEVTVTRGPVNRGR